MANPQKENGYTPIANEILEQIAKVKLSPTQYRIIFIVWRYTYGFNRKEHELSLSFLSKSTGCDKRQLQRELKDLVKKNIVKQKVKNGVGRKLEFNKRYNAWIGEIDNGGVGEIVKGTIGEIDNQERHILKTNIKTNIYIGYTSNFDLINALKDFEEMRNKIKKPMTDRARNMMLKELNKLADTDEKKIAILEQSIFNNWKGVFPLKGGLDSGTNTGQSKPNPGYDKSKWLAQDD